MSNLQDDTEADDLVEERLEGSFSRFLKRLNDGDEDFEEWLAGEPSADHAMLREYYEDFQCMTPCLEGLGSDGGAAVDEQPDSDWTEDLVEPLARIESGCRLGDFKLTKLLGRGGTGEVWEAWQLSLRRKVAVKVIRAEIAGSKRSRLRILRGAEASARLRHPGIVGIHTQGEVDGQVYVAMDLVGGGRTLADLIADGRNTVKQSAEGYRRAAQIFVKIARALQEAHAQGVIHRDIKPENILLDTRGEPVVTDFDLASLSGIPAISLVGELAGTCWYLSPEQAMAKRMAIDHRTDIFSLGVTFYESLVFERPFTGESLPEVVEQIMYTELRDPRKVRSQVPRDLAVICAKSMEKKRDRRYATMEDMADDLQRFLDGEPIRARPPGALRKTSHWCKRNRRKLGIASLLSLSVVGSLLGNWYLESSARAQQYSDFSKLDQWLSRSRSVSLVDPSQLSSVQALLKEASSLNDRLPIHEERRDSLREGALPLSREGIDRDMRTHPEYDALRVARARLRLQASTEEGGGAAQGASNGIHQSSNPVDAGGTMGPVSDKVAQLTREVSTRRTWVFESQAHRWEHDASANFVESVGRTGKVVSRLTKSIDYQGTAAEKTITGSEARSAWDSALEQLRDTEANPQYRGLVMEAQLGLLPLGQDPKSGLWEFSYVVTGEPPVRGGDPSNWNLESGTGVILVLLPGGEFTMGSDQPLPLLNGQPTYSGAIPADDEYPAHQITLDPFFISKYELTQGQYDRWSLGNGHSISAYDDETPLVGESATIHPVEQISWIQARRALLPAGLDLPTEAQWEYAARGGTRTLWFLGDQQKDLLGQFNIADAAAREAEADWDSLLDWPEYRDQYAVHAPVNSFKPNRFGLFQMTGNVAEWCLDRYGFYQVNPHVVPSTGERLIPPPRKRVIRGGSFESTARACRSAYRDMRMPEFKKYSLGVRPVRAIQGDFKQGQSR